MKNLSIILLFLLIHNSLLFSQVAINTDGSQPDISAMLDVKSKDHGVLLPRVSTLARNQIPSPATGLIIYNTTTNLFNFFNGNFWYEIGASFISATTGNLSLGGGVSINSSPDVFPENSAMLDVNNPTRGILIPRTTPELVTSPATGLIIYNKVANFLSYYDGTQWRTLCAVSTGASGASGTQSVIGMANKTDGSLPHHSAMLDVDAADKGVLIPRLTNSQRDAILPVTGLVIYNTSANKIEFYNGSGWYQLTTNCSGLPIVTTKEVTEIMATMATSGGTVTSDGGAAILKRGVCWAKTANPTIADSVTTDSIGTGNFTSRIHRLLGNTTYYLRAYATNSSGTAYGNEVSFKTTRIDYLCGNDSITLVAENNGNKGVIEWQESIDTVTWVTIPETVGETYRFLPTQTKYYRSVVKTSSTEPLLPLSFSLVQLPPVANAGSDKLVGGKITTLLGNRIEGATGEWLVLSGDSGVVAQPQNPYSQFSGIYNQDYKLTWTLTNKCGKSVDTLQVRFEEIDAKKNFIVVDNTDSIYSDSTEMASGTYRIKFSDPTIAPFDSVMLIGMRDSLSFLRKVVSFTLQDSIYNFTTEPGSFEDLFNSGTLNIGDAINQGILTGNTALKSSAIYGTNTYPTRQTLKDNVIKDQVFLLYMDENLGGNRLKTANLSNSENNMAINIQLPTKAIFEAMDGGVKITLEDFLLQLSPNFVTQFSIRPFDFKYGLENAILKYEYTLRMEATKDFKFVEKDKQILKPYKLKFAVLAFGVPIPVFLNIGLNASCDLSFDAGVTIVKKENYSNIITATIEAKNRNYPVLQLITHENSTPLTSITLNGGLHAEVEIGPEISFKIFNILGPYLKTPVALGLDLKTNALLNWSGEFSLGLKGELGAKASVEKTKLFNKYTWFDYKFSIWGDKLTKKYKLPNKLELLSGGSQKGKPGEALPYPLSFKVTDQFGHGIPLVPVWFELDSDNGSTLRSVKSTNMDGKVDVSWTMGSKPEYKLKASVLDYENLDIENSPLYVTATSGNNANSCENSNLAITLKAASKFKYPYISGGQPPYTYSINGTDYNGSMPTFEFSKPGNFIVYAKDNNQCTAVREFTISAIDPCANSDLSMDITTMANTIQVTGKKGIAPYLYSIDNQTDFSENNMFGDLSPGVHTVFVKDAKLCTVSGKTEINATITPAIKAIYPVNDASFVPATNLTFSWLAGNYATNQVYDLYLKNAGEAYVLIASDLSTTTTDCKTVLANTSSYTWKIVVKDKIGIPKAIREFTFGTASGNLTSPVVPTLLLPANGASNLALPLTLKWELQTGDFTYDVYLDETNGSRLIANNLTNSEFTVNSLISDKKYYWKVRIKKTSTGEFKESAIWNFTTQPKAETVTDIDGNIYHTVTIGTQVWMVENLKTTKFRNGEPIPNVTDGTSWGTFPFSAYCWYNNDAATYKADYGALYNWYAVADSRNIAPTGWHVPTDAEWTTLTTYLGGSTIAGGKLKEAGTSHWYSPNVGANNSSGFTALPGGNRYYGSGTFSVLGYVIYCWSSTALDATFAWTHYLVYDGANVKRDFNVKLRGFSVRCVRDNPRLLPTISTTAVTYTNPTSAISGGNITSEGSSTVVYRGVCWGTSQNPTVSDNKTIDGAGIGSFTSNLTGLAENTTYYLRAYATNNDGTSYGNEVQFKTSVANNGTVTDIDGNIYHTVTIGTQVWMVENLKTTRYRNGDQIPNVTGNASWAALTTGAYCWYNNDALTYKETYGALYNWHAVSDSRKIAPTGWHVPTDAEWTILTDFLGDENIAGGKLKETGTVHWLTPNTGATNSTGFTALPGGYRDYLDGTFGSAGEGGEWWSSTALSATSAWACDLAYIHPYIFHWWYLKQDGLSVRCVRD